MPQELLKFKVRQPDGAESTHERLQDAVNEIMEYWSGICDPEEMPYMNWFFDKSPLNMRGSGTQFFAPCKYDINALSKEQRDFYCKHILLKGLASTITPPQYGSIKR